MKRIFLLSTMIITSFGMMNLQSVSAAPQQAVSQPVTPAVGSAAKKLVVQINNAVALFGDQFSKVNDLCINYYQQLDQLNKTKPADLDAQVANLKKTRDSKIKALLTASQQKSWVELKD